MGMKGYRLDGTEIKPILAAQLSEFPTVFITNHATLFDSQAAWFSVAPGTGLPLFRGYRTTPRIPRGGFPYGFDVVPDRPVTYGGQT